MDVIFLQTAEAFRYKPMLESTSRTVVEFCRRNACDYESFIGIKRGYFPWHATFNRFFMFRELIDRGYRGWAIYLDADAFIHDLDFDLQSYLHDKRDAAGVLTSIGTDRHWEINAGVMLLNLSDQRSHEIVNRCLDRFASITDDELRALELWGDEINDQTFLFTVLDTSERLREAIHYEDGSLINGQYSRFIRQILRAHLPSLEDRIAAVRNAVDDVVGAQDEALGARVYPVAMSCLYRTLLRRDPDAGALDHFRERFTEKGIEQAFQETFTEISGSPEYKALHGIA